MTFALRSEVAGAAFPSRCPVRRPSSLLLSINTTYLCVPVGGLTSNVLVGGGCWRRSRESESESKSESEGEREREGEAGWGERAKESMKQAEEEKLGANGP